MHIQPSLLLLSCSQRKNPSPDPLPALERYDGPQFRVVRKFLREHPETATSLDIVILSAEHGLLPAGAVTPVYDRRMTRERAEELRPRILCELHCQLQRRPHRRLGIALGRHYLRAILDLESQCSPALQVTYLAGTQGHRLTALRRWLYEGAPPSAAPAQSGRTPIIRGVRIELSREQVLAAARDMLADGRSRPVPPGAWYVEIDGTPVSPKWLVSQIARLPVHAFHTTEARRVLNALGIEVSCR